MCKGGECPLKETCYRYKAESEKYGQSYFTEPPYSNEECDYYWPMITDKKQTDERAGFKVLQ